ncbi:MAG: GAF domain-containing protein [Candidatus Bathyarchaeota archaeon]|nr:GAF domain-containing protein [Candidatus Bathyarchaeota archaeon]
MESILKVDVYTARHCTQKYTLNLILIISENRNRKLGCGAILTGSVEDFSILKPVLERILNEIHEISGCESVAMRLHKDGDFPYYVHEDFPDFFVGKESSLNIKDEDGNVVLDADSVPRVECMCGNILKGRFNPTFPFFTETGSFYTNSTTQLLTTMTEEERREVGRTRDTCHHFGYESVALIPILVNGDNLGLIQLNDPREDMFTLKKIEKYELIAGHVGRVVRNILEAAEEMFHVFDLVSEFKKGEEKNLPL